MQYFYTKVKLKLYAFFVSGSLTWFAHKSPPADGRWLAFFVDLQFNTMSENIHGWPTGKDGVLEFTTSISIVPDIFPFPECSGSNCLGGLV